jgi:EAL and modified HD-GYP domain-containing signal transduction protein
VGQSTAWINVSREFLLSGMATTLPAGRVALEILEDQFIDDDLVAAVRELTELGYRFAMDDFTFTPEAEPLLELVDVVKLDLRALGREGLITEIERLAPYRVKLLAEKVETPEDHRFCLDLGADSFQGFFYRKPELLSRRRIDPGRASLMRLVARLQDPDLELSELEPLIGRDVGLSLRLLRYLNSAFFGLRREVASIPQAVALLGVENIKRWATMNAFVGLGHKSNELTRTALTRARFCELAASEVPAVDSAQLFTLGLFSVVDALTDTPIQEALAPVPFPDDMHAALIDRAGDMGDLLDAVIAIETGDFERAEGLVPGGADLYLSALGWADEAERQIAAEPVVPVA